MLNPSIRPSGRVNVCFSWASKDQQWGIEGPFGGIEDWDCDRTCGDCISDRAAVLLRLRAIIRGAVNDGSVTTVSFAFIFLTAAWRDSPLLHIWR